MKILVVHRQKSLLKGIKWVLRERDPYIRFFESGLDGLLAARMTHYDMVICGTDLPVITGFEMARALRMNSRNPDIPLVMLADEIDHKVERLGHALGVSGLLMISEISRSLAALVEEALNRIKHEDKLALVQGLSMN
ncbi:MAG: response regulator [Cyclobacteriaceae bacterium]|nr:response regulator [Cyclobacteriaceae bacterium]UYN87706.1 MAG: response regulator [Cyclobacteriaceae bacterium]